MLKVKRRFIQLTKKILLDEKEFNPDITNQKNEQKKANSLIRN